MFTRDQIEEIKKKLVAFGTKDTQLLDAHKLDGNEIVAIVQDGENRKILLSSIIGLLSDINVTPNDDFINVSKDTTGILTLDTAVSKVVINNRKLGQIITFKDSANSWAICQFTGGSLDNWNDISLWKSISGIDELKSQADTNTNNISSLNTEVSTLQSKVNENTTSISQINNTITGHEESIAQINTKLSEHTTSISENKVAIEKNTSDIKNVSDTVDAQAAKLNDVGTTLENALFKNKGYFTTLEKLNEAIPNPTIGSKAYVGTSEPYAIYIVENGAWVDSGYTGGDEIVAKITTDRIEDGAVTSEKIATSAIDDKPIAGSNNLVKSGGVYKYAPATNIFAISVPVEIKQSSKLTDIKTIQLLSGHTYRIKAVLSTDYANTYIRFVNINTSSIVTFFLFRNATIDTTYYATESQEVMVRFYSEAQSSVVSTTVDLEVIDITEETTATVQNEKIELNNFLVNSTRVFESYVASIEVYLKDGADASCSNLYIKYVGLSDGKYKVALNKVSDDSLLFRKYFTGQPAEIWAEMIGNVGFVHITFRGYPTDMVINNNAAKNILSKSCFKHLTAPSDIRNAISFSDYVPINNNTNVTSIDANYKAFCKAIHGIKVYNLSRDKSIVIKALKRYTNGNYLINIKDTSTNVITTFGPQPIEDKVISLQYGDAIIRLWIDWNALTLDHVYTGYEIPIDFGVFEPSMPFDIISNNDPDAPFVLFDASRDYTESGYISSNGTAGSNSAYVHSGYLKVTPFHTYVVSMDAFICAYTSSKTVISDGGSQGSQDLSKQVIFTAPANCEYIIVSGKVVMEGKDKSYLKVIDYNHTYADIKGCDLLKWKPLNGKKVVVFADSIAGLNRAGWPLKLEERTGARVYNCGFPGCRMEAISTDGTMDNIGTDPFAMCNLVDAIHNNDWSFQESSPLLNGSNKDYYRSSLDVLKTIDFNDIDIVLIAYGTNETGWLPMDDDNNPNSKNTYAGATRYSLNRLMADYPNINVFLLTPIYRYAWGDSDTRDSDTYVHPTKGGTLIDNVNTLKKVAHEYKVPCIDMYYELGMNIVNRDNYYLDGTHLNNNGLIRYADRVAAYIY